MNDRVPGPPYTSETAQVYYRWLVNLRRLLKEEDRQKTARHLKWRNRAKRNKIL